MRVLGVDPGSRWLAWATVDVSCGAGQYIESGTIDLDATSLFDVMKLVRAKGLDAGLVAVELSDNEKAHYGNAYADANKAMAAVSAKSKTLMRTQRYGGRIEGACEVLGYPWRSFEPQRVRLGLFGQVSPDDSTIARLLRLRVANIPKVDAHQMDAIAVALFGGLSIRLSATSSR